MQTPLTHLAETLLVALRAGGLVVATAESCTGGLVAGTITERPGSSEIFDRGFVTYSNEAKQDMLGVPEGLIAAHGAVSAEVAQAMAEGALARSRADLAVAITGVAGPGGGTAAKPVGRVHFALARRGGQTLHVARDFGPQSRSEIRTRAVEQAIGMLLSAAS